MRSRATPLLAVVLVVALLAGAWTVEAKPLPQTQKEGRKLVRDVLHDVDHGSARLLREARALVGAAQPTVAGLVEQARPENGVLEVRAALLQPGVRGADDTVAVVWVGAAQGRWTGAYWIESDAGVRSPNLLDLDEEGTLLLLDAGALALGDSMGVTYQFLGVDGARETLALGRAPLLDASPVRERADFGGAVASARGKAPEAYVLTPWNLLAANATLGLRFLAGSQVLDEFTLAACSDSAAATTEAGCRLLYVGLLPASLTSVQLWRLEGGARVVDRELDRAELVQGFTFDA